MPQRVVEPERRTVILYFLCGVKVKLVSLVGTITRDTPDTRAGFLPGEREK